MAARVVAILLAAAAMTAPATATEPVLLTVLTGASPQAYAFAMFLLSTDGQRGLAKHGFAAPALPQQGDWP
jgi:hypothetical protein